MPSRNTVREFEPDAMYHVYNRGVDKRIIFVDKRDYTVFLSFLKYALLSDEDLSKHEVINSGMISEANRFNLRRLGLHGSVELVSYCLMPNHFHLLLHQKDIDGITKLMRSISTAYVLYFNKRHKRVGALFQGVYKASRINSQGYWDHISRYIHLNPIDLGEDYKTYPYSSYLYYVGEVKSDWLRPELILDDFSDTVSYANFVEEYIPYWTELKDIKNQLANSRELEA